MTLYACIKKIKELMFIANGISLNGKKNGELLAERCKDSALAERLSELANSIQDKIDKINELLDSIENDILSISKAQEELKK